MCTPKKTFTFYKIQKSEIMGDSLISYIIKAETEALDLTKICTKYIYSNKSF